MFGKKSKMSTNDRAVMALGRKAGNLKGTNFGNSHGGKESRSGGNPNPFRKRAISPGKAGPVKMQGD
jgi:hypothetical protein